MINDNIGIVAVLLGIEAGIFYLAEYKNTKRFFNFLPPMFWIYFLPMLASTFKILPAQSEVYKFISALFLPASLLLLMLSVDIAAILKLGRKALTMMLAGSLGIILGGPLVLFIFKPWLPADIWMGFGALSASWIGGSANMLAVKEAIAVPDRVFLPMVVVDTIVAYSWMGIVIAMAGCQAKYDQWNKSDTKVMHELNDKITALEKKHSPRPLTIRYASLIIAVAIAGTYIAATAARHLPEVKNVISAHTWTIIIVTALGIMLSFTRARNLESAGASKMGYVFLYFVLASIGARASLMDIISAPLLVAAGFIWVFIHAIFLLIASRLTRAPMFLMAAASQANIGGPASAPVVAAIYQPQLAMVGLLLAVVGNIIGTGLGIFCAYLCKIV